MEPRSENVEFVHSLGGHDFDPPVYESTEGASSRWRAGALKVSSTLSHGKPATPPNAILGRTTEKLQSMTSIKDLRLLKGVPVSKAMGTFGRLFGQGGSPEEHMAMSEQVTLLQDFISHNWIVPRMTKWFTLALRYNTQAAILASYLVAFATAVVTVLTGVGLYTKSHPRYGQMPVTAFYTGHLALFAVFAFWQDLRRLLRAPPRMAFVDRACIHQTDKALMLEGIRNLAGFLRETENMVVVYSPFYLRKLWTVYEFASFLTIHRDPSRLILQPTSWAVPMVGIPLVVFGQYFTGHVLNRLGVDLYMTDNVIIALVQVAFGFFVRRWQRSVFDMEESIRTFSIRHSHCAVEADRPIVYGNVSTFMRELGRVAPHADEEEALDSFDELVREELMGSMLHAFVNSTFPLLLSLAMSAAYIFRAIDFLTFGVTTGHLVEALGWFVTNSGTPILWLAAYRLVFCPVMSLNLQLTGLREFFFFLAATLLFTLPCVNLLILPNLLLVPTLVDPTAPSPEPVHIALQVAYYAMLACINEWMRRRKSCCCCFQQRGRVDAQKAAASRAGVSISV